MTDHLETAMGPLNLLVAKTTGSGWHVVLTITPRVAVKAGQMVATAMTADDAQHLIHALERAILDANASNLAEPPELIQ